MGEVAIQTYNQLMIDFCPPWYGGEQHWCQQSDLAPRTGRGRPVDEWRRRCFGEKCWIMICFSLRYKATAAHLPNLWLPPVLVKIVYGKNWASIIHYPLYTLSIIHIIHYPLSTLSIIHIIHYPLSTLSIIHIIHYPHNPLYIVHIIDHPISSLSPVLLKIVYGENWSSICSVPISSPPG